MLCTLEMTDHTIGRRDRPLPHRRQRADRDARRRAASSTPTGRVSRVTTAGAAPSLGPVPADGVPAARARRRGHRAAGRCTWTSCSRCASTRVGSRPLFDPDDAPHEVVRSPRLREAGAGAGCADRPDGRRAGDRHDQPRVHDEPARGVRGRGGGPARRGPRRRGDRAHGRPAGGRGAAALRRQRRHGRRRARADRRAGLGPAAHGAGDRGRGRRVWRATDGPFDLLLFGNESADAGGFQVGIRVAHALGRPIVNGIKGIEVADGAGRRAARHRRRLGDVRAAAAGGGRRQGGHQPAALPDDEGAPGLEAASRSTRLDVAAEPGGQRMVRLYDPSNALRRTVILGHGADAAPAVVDLLDELGVLS